MKGRDKCQASDATHRLQLIYYKMVNTIRNVHKIKNEQVKSLNRVLRRKTDYIEIKD
jgi:hypothetical protein